LVIYKQLIYPAQFAQYTVKHMRRIQQRVDEYYHTLIKERSVFDVGKLLS
jgi:hypothetical protein